ncbi:amidohydrolase family protein [Orrella sp. NBD-18]|uniref:Amidohydrolase family protein n=1 Tax=Sheuella amnicola TaxID=2707330 RepID=A0A6B2QXB4_9BURK|nr:amidohydrolase family protein [Sheuella amnicola]NDY82691.1 amidohydrolase family protein [Sheuella amnicola]
MLNFLISLALTLGLLASANADPAKTTRYTILLENGTLAGEQTVERVGQDIFKVHFDFKENGRGPTLDETIKMAPDQTMLEYHVKGTSEMGGMVDERFIRKGNVAEWSSKSEKGSKRLRGKGFYLPLDSSWQVNSLMISALSNSRPSSLPLLPEGTLVQHRLAEQVVTHEDQSQVVQLVMHTGIGLSPQFFWATTGADSHLFAVILPGNFAVIKDGWQSNLLELKNTQIEETAKILAVRAKELQHPMTGLTVIRNARVFNSESATLGSLSDVYVLRGRITGVYPAGQNLTPVDNEINAAGRVMLPGLYDMHAHINRWSASYHLTAGVTSVRDLGNANAELQKMIDDTLEGKLLAPRLIPAGFVDGDSPYASHDGFTVTDINDIKHAIDWYTLRGYYQLKVYNSFPPELLADTVSYAHKRGLKISGHVPAFVRADDVLNQGFDELHHVNQLLLNFLATDKTDTRTLERFYLPAEKVAAMDFNTPEILEFIERLKQRNTVVDPTLATFDFLKHRDGEVAEPYKSIAPNMPPDIVRSFKTATMKIPDEQTAKRYEASYKKMIEFVGKLYRAGVPIVAGTDGLAGFTLHSELELYVKAGMTPAQAIQVATWNGAKYSNTLNDRGSISRGKLADLILIDGDPTRNIEDIRKVSVVITRGKLIYPNQINEALGVKPFVKTPPKLIKLNE